MKSNLSLKFIKSVIFFFLKHKRDYDFYHQKLLAFPKIEFLLLKLFKQKLKDYWNDY